MSKVTLEACKGGFEDKIKQLIKLKDDHAEVGWFGEQGQHPTAEMTFAELARYHATGQNGVTPRPMLHIALTEFAGTTPREVGQAIAKYLDNPNETNLDMIIESIGKEYWETVKHVLGNPSFLKVTGNPSPLVDTRELKAHTAYRTSRDRTLKTEGIPDA